MPGPEGAEAIRRLSAETARSGKHPWERELAARTGGLPVHADMGGALVVTVEGKILLLDHDTDGIEETADEATVRFARTLASRMHPALASWAPVRPADARICEACGGTGVLELAKRSFHCGKCSSTGWVA